jgi:hypothetical protein
MNRGGLSTVQMRMALILYSVNGLDNAVEFVNAVILDKKIKGADNA